MDESHPVVVVVDPEFGARPLDLARDLPVWIRESPANLEWARRARAGREAEVTTFRSDVSVPPEEALLDVVATVDLHHGPFSQDPPWTVLRVIGARPTPDVRGALQAYGVQEIEPCESGFEARRPVPE